MDKKFDDEYDVIVVGTGLIESIVVAACSRIGQKTLHLDPNDYYGDVWTNFSFSRLLEWIEYLNSNEGNYSLEEGRKTTGGDVPGKADAPTLPSTITLEPNHRFIPWTKAERVINNIEINSYLEEEESATGLAQQEEGENEDREDNDREDSIWTLEKMKSQKIWGIDLAPRLLFARGSMSSLLASSNVSRYLPFHAAERILSCLPGVDELVDVPCTRQDIFNDKLTSLIEKRVLMRLIAMGIEIQRNPEASAAFEGSEDQPFIEFLRHKGFTPLLQHLVLNSVAMCEPTTPTHEAMGNLEKFIASSGVFGNTPFIFPFYGFGEIPQAFCRLSAVFGGTYCLKQPVKGFLLSEGRVKSVLVENQAIKCKYLVTNLSNCPRNLLAIRYRSQISRAIFISNGSIKGSPQAESILRFPGPFPIFVIEVSSASIVSPKGLYIVYAWCNSYTGNPKKDLLPIARKLFSFDKVDVTCDHNRPKLLWCCFFHQTYVDCSSVCNSFKNMFVTSPPFNELDYDKAIGEARQIFSDMYPDEEFLPRAPDYNEIVIETEPSTESV